MILSQNRRCKNDTGCANAPKTPESGKINPPGPSSFRRRRRRKQATGPRRSVAGPIPGVRAALAARLTCGERARSARQPRELFESLRAGLRAGATRPTGYRATWFHTPTGAQWCVLITPGNGR